MNIKKISILLALPAAMLFSACEQDNMGEMYDLTTQGVSFGATSQNASLPSEYTTETISVEVLRSETNGAASIGLSFSVIDDDENVLPSTGFQVPATVDFADGEFTATVNITVDNTITPGMNYNVVLALDETQAIADAAAMTQKVVTVFRDYTFTTIGMGTYISTFFVADYDGDGKPDGPLIMEVEVQKADQANIYKVVDLYETGYDVRFQVADEPDSKGRYRVTVARQAALSDLSGYGTTYVAGSGLLQNGVIEIPLEFTVSAGSFGSASETLYLPTESAIE